MTIFVYFCFTLKLFSLKIVFTFCWKKIQFLKSKGATIDKLIEKLVTVEDGLGTNESSSAMMYILSFLLTYRSFTTPDYLLGRLIE